VLPTVACAPRFPFAWLLSTHLFLPFLERCDVDRAQQGRRGPDEGSQARHEEDLRVLSGADNALALDVAQQEVDGFLVQAKLLQLTWLQR